MHSKLILKLPRQPLFLHVFNFGDHGFANLLIFFCVGLWKLSLHTCFIFTVILAFLMTKVLFGSESKGLFKVVANLNTFLTESLLTFINMKYEKEELE